MGYLDRKVISCYQCKLRQFVASDHKCRRCHQFVAPTLAVVPIRVNHTLAPVNDVNNPKGFINIPAAIRLLRNAFNFSQRDLSSRMGVARPYISRMERCLCTPGMDTLYRIAKAFEITPYAFISIAEALAQ